MNHYRSCPLNILLAYDVILYILEASRKCKFVLYHLKCHTVKSKHSSMQILHICELYFPSMPNTQQEVNKTDDPITKLPDK